MQLEARREMWKNTTNGAFYMQHKSGHQLVQMVLAGQDSGQAAPSNLPPGLGMEVMWKYIFFMSFCSMENCSFHRVLLAASSGDMVRCSWTRVAIKFYFIG